jgi:hypothetical protein
MAAQLVDPRAVLSSTELYIYCIYRRRRNTNKARERQNDDWTATKYERLKINAKISREGMVSSGMLRHVALVRTDVSEELSASIIREKKIGELGTCAKLLRNVGSYKSHTA